MIHCSLDEAKVHAQLFWDFLRSYMVLNFRLVAHVRLYDYFVTYQILVTPINRINREKTLSLGYFSGSLNTERKDNVKVCLSNIYFTLKHKSIK